MLLFTKTCGKSVLQLPSYYLISPSLSLSFYAYSLFLSIFYSLTRIQLWSLYLSQIRTQSATLSLSLSLSASASLSHTHTHSCTPSVVTHSCTKFLCSPLNCFGLTPCLCCLWLIRVDSIFLKYLSSSTFQVSKDDPYQRAPRCQSIFFHGELLRTGTDRCKRRRQSDIVSQTKI